MPRGIKIQYREPLEPFIRRGLTGVVCQDLKEADLAPQLLHTGIIMRMVMLLLLLLLLHFAMACISLALLCDDSPAGSAIATLGDGAVQL